MRKSLFVIFYFLGFIVSFPSLALSRGSGETDGYRLVWQDLFDADSLNTQRWNIEVTSSGSGNNELQFYTDRSDNVCLGTDPEGNRCLILTARREQYGDKDFTSGRINSLGKTSFRYGKIEAMIKLPQTSDGLWPAFWMMGNDYETSGWPKCGETDILEMGHADGISAGLQSTYFNGACHWGQGWPAASHVKAAQWPYSLQDGEYHLFTLIWDENNINMFTDLDRNPDSEPYFSLDISFTDEEDPWSPGNYFHKEGFIIFNLAVGGDFTGIHEAENVTALNEDNGNVASMYIDFVKVYQKGTTLEMASFSDAGDLPTEEYLAEQTLENHNTEL